MFKATRYMPALLAATVFVATPACATGGYYQQQHSVGDRDDRTFYDRGFNEGRALGFEDARRGLALDAHAHREYRDIGHQHLERDDVRVYRHGFETGYAAGYREFARTRHDYPPRPYPPQDRRFER